MTSDLEKYYSSARIGSLACVRRRDEVYGEQYIFTRVIGRSAGQVKTLFGTFWSINGERVDSRHNGRDNCLIIPTIDAIDAEEANLISRYQFGIDRKFELAAARAVLERRATKMPNVPPPPTPTLEEAEAELREATNHWMNVDQIVGSPEYIFRARRAASERLAAAKSNFSLAENVHGASLKKLTGSKIESGLSRKTEYIKNPNENKSVAGNPLSMRVGNRYKFAYNSIEVTSYTFTISSIFDIKRN